MRDEKAKKQKNIEEILKLLLNSPPEKVAELAAFIKAYLS